MASGQWLPAGRTHSRSAKVGQAKVGQAVMPANVTQDDPERAQRFRDAALPHLDDVYTLARLAYSARQTLRRIANSHGFIAGPR